MQRIEKLPIGFLATWLGFTTLSNVYHYIGLSSLRYVTMYIGVIILLTKAIKFVFFTKQCKEEYENAILASLYPAWGMLMMLIGSYFATKYYLIGKIMWTTGFIFHAFLIISFTIKHVLIKFNYQTFFPSWFVTYTGILVGTVSGEHMNMPQIMIDGLMIYGFALIPLLYIPMIIRVLVHRISDTFIHTTGIFLAPLSLIINTYIIYGYADKNPLVL
ncbi:MAG: TDT family transporter, partial [Brevinema sp.]